MNERSTLILILTGLYLGSRIPADIGQGAFDAFLGAGWAVAVHLDDRRLASRR